MQKERIALPALVAALVCAGIGAPAAGAAAELVSLEPAHQTAPFGSSVQLAGAIAPARRTHVELFELDSGAWQLVAAVETAEDGSFSFRITARRPAVYVARTDAAESAQALVRIRPILRASIEGVAVVGAGLAVVGQLRPAASGTLRLTTRGRSRTVSLDDTGRFEATLPTRAAGRLTLALRLDPEDGYAELRRRLVTRVRAPRLGLGAHGPAVRFLERRLSSLRYALRGVDGRFRSDTREALYAFQKVRGLPRNGLAGPVVWRALRHARIPVAAVPRGDHLEVDKARQILFEVRRGRVVRIVHVSTGATGNTPIGRWRVYRKTPGFNSLSMYYSMYFLRGFAFHGYHSVPPWPASHGCVRLPLWFAPRLYARWPSRSVVWVLPTTARASSLWQSPAAVRRAEAPAAARPVGP